MKRAQTANHRFVLNAARWLLGVVFVVSALGKVADPAAFAENVAAYRLLPLPLVNLFAIVMPWVELLVGLALLNGMALAGAALLATLLNVMFIGAAASAMVRGLDVECGCFTVARSTVGWGLIARDLVFLALALICYRYAEENDERRTMNEER